MTYFLENKENWTPAKRVQYINELTRKQSSLIFRARCRMIKVKGNHKNEHTDLNCRMCKNAEETQAHILKQCPALHPNDTVKVTKHQLFNEDTGNLTHMAGNLGTIMEKLSEIVY